LLVDGQPQRHVSNLGEYKYFLFWYGFPEEESVTIGVQSEEGGVDIYVSDELSNSNPNLEKHKWKGVSQGSFSWYEIIKNSKLGWYYFGVHALANTTYVITATTQYSK
jgi:hypothetical protein